MLVLVVEYHITSEHKPPLVPCLYPPTSFLEPAGLTDLRGVQLSTSVT